MVEWFSVTFKYVFGLPFSVRIDTAFHARSCSLCEVLLNHKNHGPSTAQLAGKQLSLWDPSQVDVSAKESTITKVFRCMLKVDTSTSVVTKLKYMNM